MDEKKGFAHHAVSDEELDIISGGAGDGRVYCELCGTDITESYRNAGRFTGKRCVDCYIKNTDWSSGGGSKTGMIL